MACAIAAGSPLSGQEAKTVPAGMVPQISAITLGVENLQVSYRFYKEGLGLPAERTPSDGIVLFSTMGTKLFLYPYPQLAADAGSSAPAASRPRGQDFPGFTLGHAVRTKEEVDRLLAAAEKAGGKVVKPARATSWGGYSGYFSDPDGYLWEVLYAPNLKFDRHGNVILP